MFRSIVVLALVGITIIIENIVFLIKKSLILLIYDYKH
jgi:hypothetical protein